MAVLTTLLVLFPAAGAKPAASSRGGLLGRRVTISCEDGMTATGNRRHAIFKGAVRLTQEDVKLTCDRLELTWSEDKAGVLGITDLVAVGNVTLEQPSREISAKSDSLRYDHLRKVMVFEGTPAAVVRRGGNELRGRSVQLDATNESLVSSGSSVLTIDLDDKAKP